MPSASSAASTAETAATAKTRTRATVPIGLPFSRGIVGAALSGSDRFERRSHVVALGFRGRQGEAKHRPAVLALELERPAHHARQLERDRETEAAARRLRA